MSISFPKGEFACLSRIALSISDWHSFSSSILNPDHVPICIDQLNSPADLPIRINQTEPILIELLRIDLDTGRNETISIPSKQLKQLKRQADKKNADASVTHRDLLFPVRKTGIYRLQRVVDESDLDVRIRLSDALVVACPAASLKPSHSHKCKGELSDLLLEVEGTPPLRIKYSRRVNRVDRGFSFQNVQPDNLRSPLLNHVYSKTLFDPRQADIAWAQSRKIQVPLNESLNTDGEWLYSIEEVHDGCGNLANYSAHLDATTGVPSPWHRFTVHERPRLSLFGCDDQHFLEFARGDSVQLPLKFRSAGQGYTDDGPFMLSYAFSYPDTESVAPGKVRDLSLKSVEQAPLVREPGWYTLSSISSQFCYGEILEPSSCYLHNPPEPELTVRYEKIFDKCANNSVGLLVDLDLIGSPPFRLRYSVEHSKGVTTHSRTIDGSHTQFDFTPMDAGYYRYRFLDIADAVYGPRSLKDKAPVLEQDVKPPASARYLGSRQVRKACFGEPVSLDVGFLGESPWTLQYELVHNGKKTKHVLESRSEISTITTDKLVSGGEYSLALTSVKDRSNCKRLLLDSIKIDARPKRPHVSFGQVDKKRSVSALQNSKVDIPLRLGGERPWTVKYRNGDQLFEKMFWTENSILTVARDGDYQLVGVFDSSCPGEVDQSAKSFAVSWIPRPRITSIDGQPVTPGAHIAKKEVCQGDGDNAEVKLSGNAPYAVRYEQQQKPSSGASSSPGREHTLRTALHVSSVEMDTSRDGQNVYRFLELGDSLYNGDRREPPIVMTQQVNPLPSARFDSPGHIYSFCKEDTTGDELIPVTLEGVPPFSLEINIKRHSSANPDIVSIPHINSKRHKLPIPRRHLELGQQFVSIHKVRDARGCQRVADLDAPSVRVSVSDVPTIIPLESKVDYCVGERLSFSLSGNTPFDVFYSFNGIQRKATSQATTFRRIAETPGTFTVTGISDNASGRCKAYKDITKIIHEMPSVRISNGQVSVVDIHEGGEAEIHFEFWGTPPFEFT